MRISDHNVSRLRRAKQLLHQVAGTAENPVIDLRVNFYVRRSPHEGGDVVSLAEAMIKQIDYLLEQDQSKRDIDIALRNSMKGTHDG